MANQRNNPGTLRWRSEVTCLARDGREMPHTLFSYLRNSQHHPWLPVYNTPPLLPCTLLKIFIFPLSAARDVHFNQVSLGFKYGVGHFTQCDLLRAPHLDMTLFDFWFIETKKKKASHPPFQKDYLALYVVNSLTHTRHKNEPSTNQITAFHFLGHSTLEGFTKLRSLYKYTTRWAFLGRI